MAGLLLLGAIPSGLAGTAQSAQHLYVLRFFIGILGGTFVPCQAWTSAFFDKNCVGSANALVGGWGNMGGGATFAIMVSLYASLRGDGLSQYSAWRAAFAIVPVPILVSVAVVTLLFGQDHPAGKWRDRGNTPAAKALAQAQARTEQNTNQPMQYESEKSNITKSEKDLEGGTTASVHPASDSDSPDSEEPSITVSTPAPLTFHALIHILLSSTTWLVALSYMTTFGLELALDGQMANILFGLFGTRVAGFDQTKAGYYTSIL